MALTDSLIAHYLLGNNAKDSHGSYDGIVSGTIEFTGNDAVFDGENAYIDSTYKTSNSNNTYTISAWVARNTIDTPDAVYAEMNSTSNSYGTYITFGSSDSLSVGHFKNISGEYDDVGGALTATTELTHIVFTRENGAAHKLYIDGVLYNTVSCSNVSNASSYTGRIGGNPTYSSNPDLRAFDGSISNFRIYSDVKNQSFVDDLYDEGSHPQPWQSFLDISEDVGMVSESFLDISQDELPIFQVFKDVSEDVPMVIELFQDISIDHQGYIEIFSDVSTNESGMFWRRFYDVSADIPDTLTSIVIKRINE